MTTAVQVAFEGGQWRFYLLSPNQEEVHRSQVDAEFLTELQQQLPDGHTWADGQGVTRAIR